MLPFLDVWRELINCGNDVMQSVQPTPVQKHKILEIPLTQIPRNSPPPRQKVFEARNNPTSIPLTNFDKNFDTNKPNSPSFNYSFTLPSPVHQSTPSKAKCVVLIHADIPIQSNPSTKTIEKSPQKYETLQKSTQFERREVSLTPPVPNNSPTTNFYIT